MASLEILLGVVAGVVLIGVLAVRVSVRLGLPSLLLYLGIGRAARRVRAGHPVLRRRAHRVARAGRPGRDPHRGRSDHPLVRGPTRAGRRHRAVHGGRTGQHRGGRGGAAPAARAGVAHRVPVGRGAVVHRRRRGVQRAARGGRVPPGVRHAGAGVGAERRAGRAGRVAAGLRRPVDLDDPAAGGLRAGRRRGDRRAVRLGRCVGAAPGGAAVHRSLPAGRHRRVLPRLLGRAAPARLRAAGHLRRRPGARQRRAAAPRRGALVRRGHGLAGPDRAVRAARAVRLAAPAAGRRAAGAGRGWGAGAAGPAAVGARRRAAVPPPVARAGCSCPGPGCAGRCPSCSR